MDKKEYKIIVDGCDDSTSTTMVLTEEEFALVKKVAEAVTSASDNTVCKPTMSVLPN